MKPKILTTLPGYTRALLVQDALAGVTVAMVALPLSLAIAIASGADPSKGLITAIVAGFLISLLGGSRVQIGGPTGAFIVVVFGVVAEHGYDGLVLATFMAGLILLVAGLFPGGKPHSADTRTGHKRLYYRDRRHHRDKSAQRPSWALGCQRSRQSFLQKLKCFGRRGRPFR